MEMNLREKGGLVESLWHSVNGATGDLKNVPGLIRRVIETEAWRERIYRGKTYRHLTFLAFVTTKPLAGCGWPPEKVQALLRDEPEIEALFRQATTSAKGRPTKENSDNVTIKPERGNGRAYTLTRLKRERPELFERVVAGKLSANAAAIEAGFRRKSTPFEIIEKLLPKLSPVERAKLRQLLSET